MGNFEKEITMTDTSIVGVWRLVTFEFHATDGTSFIRSAGRRAARSSITWKVPLSEHGRQ